MHTKIPVANMLLSTLHEAQYGYGLPDVHIPHSHINLSYPACLVWVRLANTLSSLRLITMHDHPIMRQIPLDFFGRPILLFLLSKSFVEISSDLCLRLGDHIFFPSKLFSKSVESWHGNRMIIRQTWLWRTAGQTHFEHDVSSKRLLQ